MLTQVAQGIHLHVSEFCQSNTVVVVGASGVLLIDVGVLESEIVDLANDLAGLGLGVVAGFSTHPHWDHLLWHPVLGEAPRYATAVAAMTATQRLAGGIDAKRFGIPEAVSLELVGKVTGLPTGAVRIPWDGPEVRILEHSAHAPGHAALLIDGGAGDGRVLVAGDMLSDVFMPMLDRNGTVDPLGDYVSALDLIGGVAGDIRHVIPGHGSVGGAEEFHGRLKQDRMYVEALRDGRIPSDPRVDDPEPGWEWVRDAHARQLSGLAQRG